MHMSAGFHSRPDEFAAGFLYSSIVPSLVHKCQKYTYVCRHGTRSIGNPHRGLCPGTASMNRTCTGSRQPNRGCNGGSAPLPGRDCNTIHSLHMSVFDDVVLSEHSVSFASTTRAKLRSQLRTSNQLSGSSLAKSSKMSFLKRRLLDPSGNLRPAA